MKNGLDNLIALTILASALALQGCTSVPYDGKPGMNEEINAMTDNTVVRMTVTWTERPDHAYMLPDYNVMGKYFHWSENSNQYRWTRVTATLRRDKYGSIVRHAMIPDGMQLLTPGDVVDVYVPAWETMNYGTLDTAKIIKLVCQAKDAECIRSNGSSVGGKGTEIISRGRPDMTGISYSKKFDIKGQLLK
ncbi:hypothetical protein GTP46_11320 [Duganella sp. FT135W]|uniref:Lipoprotein n=1 Tax=Duganella flavida TaxID=2692175 RepID=A0A6L8K779_9BURK|nr:hypothetical protein [Duganella flavida]MYM23236.1 hypothetical protein [Duganella flavida]